MATSVLMKATTRLLLGATAVVRAVGANAQVPATVAGPIGSMMNPMAMMNQPGARAPIPGMTPGYPQQAPAQGLMNLEQYTQWFGERQRR